MYGDKIASIERNQAVARSFIEEVVNQGHSAAAELFGPSYAVYFAGSTRPLDDL